MCSIAGIKAKNLRGFTKDNCHFPDGKQPRRPQPIYMIETVRLRIFIGWDERALSLQGPWQRTIGNRNTGLCIPGTPCTWPGPGGCWTVLGVQAGSCLTGLLSSRPLNTISWRTRRSLSTPTFRTTRYEDFFLSRTEPAGIHDTDFRLVLAGWKGLRFLAAFIGTH